MPEAAPIPEKGHAALRRGRWSAPGAEYFLTICTEDRRQDLALVDTPARLIAGAQQLETEGAWHLRTMTVMPDHLHLLVILGDAFPLSEVTRRFKGRHASTLRAHRTKWERGSFDHRLRETDDRLPVFLYIFLNPYRANLLSRDERWPAYYCCPEDWRWFEPLTDHDSPDAGVVDVATANRVRICRSCRSGFTPRLVRDLNRVRVAAKCRSYSSRSAAVE